MRILIVEDDENKGNQLKVFLAELFPKADLWLARSLQSGVKRIRAEQPDLVILDMTLPNYDAGPGEPGGGATHSFGGREFLRQMDRFDINVPAIVVTQFETFGKSPHDMDLAELDAELKEEHSPTYRGSVYYHAAIHGWQDQLKQMIEAVLAAENGDA
jgi:CheY-like chemotaxis protein